MYTEVQFSEKNNMSSEKNWYIFLQLWIQFFFNIFYQNDYQIFFPSGEKTFLVNRTIT